MSKELESVQARVIGNRELCVKLDHTQRGARYRIPIGFGKMLLIYFQFNPAPHVCFSKCSHAVISPDGSPTSQQSVI